MSSSMPFRCESVSPSSSLSSLPIFFHYTNVRDSGAGRSPHIDGVSCWLTLLVKVMTSTLPGSVPSCTMRATRAVTTRVLPLKAGTGGGERRAFL